MNPQSARVAVIITVMAAALVAAACGGSPSSGGSGGSPNAGGSANSRALAYSRCVRSHGVPGFPDPDSNGQISKEAVMRAFNVVGEPRAKAATYACANLNPFGEVNPILTTQEQQDYLKAAACMRSHGISNFPDPTFPGGRVNFPALSGLDTKSQQFTHAEQTCIQLIPPGLPGRRPGG